MAVLAEEDLGKFCGGVEVLCLNVRTSKVHAGACADVSKSVPLIHAILSNTNLNVESVVILAIDLAFRQIFVSMSGGRALLVEAWVILPKLAVD